MWTRQTQVIFSACRLNKHLNMVDQTLFVHRIMLRNNVRRFPKPNYRVSNERMLMKMKVDNNSKLEHSLIEEFPDVTKDILKPCKILVRFFSRVHLYATPVACVRLPYWIIDWKSRGERSLPRTVWRGNCSPKIVHAGRLALLAELFW